LGRDPEYLAFLRRVAAAAAAADPEATLAQRRAAHAAGLAHVPRTPIAEQRDVLVDGRLPARLYRPHLGNGQPGLVFFHGGGWSLGSVDAYEPVVQALAAASGVAFLSVGCRLAPEHPFPAAVEDGPPRRRGRRATPPASASTRRGWAWPETARAATSPRWPRAGSPAAKRRRGV
jgi:acetyl esterase